MATESKMVSVRLAFRASERLVERIDFVAKNTADSALASRSAVVKAAIEAYLPAFENDLRQHLKKVGAAFPERK